MISRNANGKIVMSIGFSHLYSFTFTFNLQGGHAEHSKTVHLILFYCPCFVFQEYCAVDNIRALKTCESGKPVDFTFQQDDVVRKQSYRDHSIV